MYASRNLNVDGHHVGHPETSPKRRRISASQASQPAATGRARARRGHVLHTFPAHVSWNGRAQHGWRKGPNRMGSQHWAHTVHAGSVPVSREVSRLRCDRHAVHRLMPPMDGRPHVHVTIPC